MSSKRPDQYENFLTFLHSLKTSNSPTNTNNNINRTIENEYLTNTQKFYDDHFGRNYDSEDEENQQNAKKQPQKGVSEIKTKSSNDNVSKKISQSELSTKGALDLAKDYHEDVDDLLELCDQVNQAAADSIEEQGVNRNESSDPIQEDMFKAVFGFLFLFFRVQKKISLFPNK